MTPYERLRLLIYEYYRVYGYKSYKDAVKSIKADLKVIEKEVSHELVS